VTSVATETYVAGIDVGTTKIRTIVAQPDVGEQLRIIGVGLVPAAGLARGIVVDRELATAAIAESVRRAGRMASREVAAAYVGVTGAHVACRNVTGRVHLPTGEVTRADIEKVQQSARDNIRTTSEQAIIHSLVRDYAVDGEQGIARPLGMHGSRLDVELHIVTGVESIIANLEDCVTGAGVRVLRHILEPVATAAAVATPAERDLGVIIVDIGGGTTDVAVFDEGSICHTASIAVAGNHVTRDLAQVLRITPEDAETAKRRFGCALADQASGSEMIQVSEVGSQEETRIPRRLLGEIIQPRMEEIFALVKENLRTAGVWGTAGGIVLSGGGSQLLGADRLCSVVMDDMPVRIGSPRNLTGLADSVDSPIFATAVGLAMLAAGDQAWAVPLVRAGLAPWWEHLQGWWHHYLAPYVTGSRPSGR
jgi:cell division protein FtsA